MKRIDEKASANEFVEKLKNGFYSHNCSQNAEADYHASKEQRDTKAVKDFVNSSLFGSLRALM